jgi:hypothetical protein
MLCSVKKKNGEACSVPAQIASLPSAGTATSTIRTACTRDASTTVRLSLGLGRDRRGRRPSPRQSPGLQPVGELGSQASRRLGGTGRER